METTIHGKDFEAAVENDMQQPAILNSIFDFSFIKFGKFLKKYQF